VIEEKPNAAVLCQRRRERGPSGREHFMFESQEYNGQSEGRTEEAKIPSPSEKLEENKPLGSLVPGAENDESLEIKNEIKPNTE
jgi:hypothetical protein